MDQFQDRGSRVNSGDLILGPTRDVPLKVLFSILLSRNLDVPEPEDLEHGSVRVGELLDWMTDDNNSEAQWDAVAREVSPWIERWYPDLKQLPQYVSELEKVTKENTTKENAAVWSAVTEWIETVKKDLNLPPHLPVGKIPVDDHVSIHPYDSLVIESGLSGEIIHFDPTKDDSKEDWE